MTPKTDATPHSTGAEPSRVNRSFVPHELIAAINAATGSNEWQKDSTAGELLAPAVTAILALRATAAPAVQSEPTRQCTCHPDDAPPKPCAQKYALSECRAAQPAPAPAVAMTDAHIELITRLRSMAVTLTNIVNDWDSDGKTVETSTRTLMRAADCLNVARAAIEAHHGIPAPGAMKETE